MGLEVNARGILLARVGRRTPKNWCVLSECFLAHPEFSEGIRRLRSSVCGYSNCLIGAISAPVVTENGISYVITKLTVNQNASSSPLQTCYIN
jgi:hypothetical protein